MDGLKPSLIIYWWLKIQYILMHIQGIKEKRFGRLWLKEMQTRPTEAMRTPWELTVALLCCWDGRWKSWSDLNVVVLICLLSRSPSKRRELRLVQCTKSRSKEAWTFFGFCKYLYVIPIVLLHVCLWNRSPLQLFYLISSKFCRTIGFPVPVSFLEWRHAVHSGFT